MRLRLSLLAGALAAGTASATAQPQQIVDQIEKTVERAVDGAPWGHETTWTLDRVDDYPAHLRPVDPGGRNASPADQTGATGGSASPTSRERRRRWIGRRVSIDAVKRTRGGSSQLANDRIDVDSIPVRRRGPHTARNGNDRVSVDYAVVVPTGVAVKPGRYQGTSR